MTDFLKVTKNMSVAPQITADDIKRAAAEGVSLIINNRPDGEEAGQPLNSELASVAADHGIKWAHIPVVSGQLTMEGIEQMALAMKEDVKTLAYCRSGTRSCTLWGLAEAFSGRLATDDILARGAEAGYDLSGMAPTLEHLREASGS